jgi:hypothetical protein
MLALGVFTGDYFACRAEISYETVSKPLLS